MSQRTGQPDAPEQDGLARSLRHELRTPINHILGFAALLREDAEDRGDRPSMATLQGIEAAGRAALTLVDDLVDANPPGGLQAPRERLRATLSEIIPGCDLLRTDAERRNDRDAVADVEHIREAVTRLLTLVAQRTGEPTPNAVDTNRPRGAQAARATTDGMPTGTVLVVDDDRANRELLARRLERLGHAVVVASGGRQALDLLAAAPVDLVLLDVMMPEMDGFEVLARLKADPRLRELPVIVLSAMSDVSAAVRCIELGADDYLPKPFDPVLLRARIGACMEKKRLRDRELAYLRQAAQVTGPAVIAHLLTSTDDGAPDDGEAAALLAAIDTVGERLPLAKGTTLFAAGEPGDSMYAVLSGRLELRMEEEPGLVRSVGEIRRGEPVGELDMLTGRPRTLTVVALRDAELVRLSRSHFVQLAIDFPRLLTRTTSDVIDRLRAAFERHPSHENVTAITLLPVSAGVPAGDLAQWLADALGAIVPTLHLDAGRAREALGAEAGALLVDGGEHPRLGSWLDALELRHRYVIYEADSASTPWTRRCLRQADRVLLVGRGQPGRLAEQLEAELRHVAGTAVTELVLLNDAGPRQTEGTIAWLQRWPVHMHHHVRPNATEDLQRLLRHLTGRSIELVLSGGGARGWAHLGVMQALEEAGIPVDAIGGASMGALLGGTAAYGLSSREVTDLGRIFSSPRSIFDYTLPMVSLLSGQKLMRVLQTVFGETQIEDLQRPYFCVSSSLTHTELVIHRRGPLWHAVRESVSLPGIFPPVAREGDLLVDGAYLNNLPIDVMREIHGDGTVIAVNANPREEPLQTCDIGPAVSGWQVLWRRLAPWAAPVQAPSIAATILRSSSLNGAYRLAASERMADLAISPPVAQFGILDFAAYEQIIKIGYEDAKRRIAAWQERQERDESSTTTAPRNGELAVVPVVTAS